MEPIMNLNITSELVRDLYDRARRSGRPAETGLVLGPDGWDTLTWTSPSAPLPVAITGEDIHALLDGDEPRDGQDLEEDIVAMLTTPEPAEGTSYAVPAEDGELREPGADDIAQVVTGRQVDGENLGGLAETMDWPEAWWFSLREARQLTTTTGDRDGYERDAELWLTAGGRYVSRRASSHVNEPGDSWAQVSTEQAAEWLYYCDTDHLAEDLTDAGTGQLGQDAPPMLVSARALRAATDAITAPRVPYVTGDFDTRIPRPEDVEDQAREVEATAAALAALTRNIVVRDLTRQRRHAMTILVDVYGSQSETARRLGLAQPTVNALVK
jgi:hypothetical protein